MDFEVRREGAGFALTVAGQAAPPMALSRAEYEDLFYPLPLNTTAYYRLLTDHVFADAERRRAFLALLAAFESRAAGLEALQRAVLAQPPEA